MRALRFDGERLALAEVAPPRPAPGEALVRVRLAGICHTDLELTRGYMGFRGTLGHEFVGELVGDAPRRVVGEINAACGECAACRAGLGRHCPTRTVLGILGRDGAFAEYLTLPLVNLHPVPDGVPDERAVFVEPLAAALEILEQVPVRPSDRVLVLGDGKLGQLVARVLAATGCALSVVGHHPAKRALLARAGIPCLAEPPAERADVVVDCTGRAAGFVQAMRLVRPRGILVLKSTVAPQPPPGRGAAGDGAYVEPPLHLAPLVIDEISVVGSRCGPFAPALRALAERRVDVDPLVSGEYPLGRGVEAFDGAARRDVMKVLLRP